MKNKGSAKAKAKAMIAKVVKAAATKQKQPKKQKNNSASVSQKLLNSAASIGMSLAGKAISRITGVGDYQVKSNSIETTGGSISGEVPHFGKENNSTRVRHREFVKDVAVPATPASFTNTAYVINPSNSDLFPWLSKFAENYQQYRVHGMVLIFKTTTSDYSASGGMGKVAMATNYNVRDSSYANMIELENAEFSVSGKPSMSRVHPIECASNNGLPLVRYVRDTQYDASGGDDRLYDVGKFQFATQGLPGTANTIIGELWVSYDIEFYKPIVGRNPVAVQYNPVSVPVFDTQGGGGQSLYQIERSVIPVVSTWTHNQLWEAMLSPGAGTRVAPIDIQSAQISRSVFRPTPDPSSDVNGLFPAYWDTASHLILQRKGIYTIKLFMRPKVSSVERDANTISTYALSNTGVATNNPSILDRLPRILVAQDSSMIPQYSVLNGTASTGYVPASPGNTNYTATGVTGTRVFGGGCEWYLSIWVYEDHPSGDGVRIKFFGETPSDSTSPLDGGTKFSWYGSQLISVANMSQIECTIGFTNVGLRTFYTPALQTLTSDDESLLKTSVGSVLALLPKLRDLGLVD